MREQATLERAERLRALKAILDNACRASSLITADQVVELINEMEHTTTLLPFIDPTRYMAIANTAPDHIRVARAFLTFRQVLEKVTGQ